jgi:TBC1 domain family member 15
VRKLQEILLTYNAYEKELGYVQGMSDLCSPLYVVMDSDEILTFWAFVGLMSRMVRIRSLSSAGRQLAHGGRLW